jgi:hypothetical protein
MFRGPSLSSSSGNSSLITRIELVLEMLVYLSFNHLMLHDDEDRNGPQNVGLLAIQPPDAAASPRIFYWYPFWSYMLISKDKHSQMKHIIHVPCNRLIIQYLIQQTAWSIINNNLNGYYYKWYLLLILQLLDQILCTLKWGSFNTENINSFCVGFCHIVS